MCRATWWLALQDFYALPGGVWNSLSGMLLLAIGIMFSDLVRVLLRTLRLQHWNVIWVTLEWKFVSDCRWTARLSKECESQSESAWAALAGFESFSRPLQVYTSSKFNPRYSQIKYICEDDGTPITIVILQKCYFSFLQGPESKCHSSSISRPITKSRRRGNASCSHIAQSKHKQELQDTQ